jgi:glycosyltransferase involved in cell wall biosynthesis
MLKDHIEKNKSENLNAQLVGHVFNKDIYDFYFNHPVDLIINLSTSEGIPVSLMEAQSYGIPAIATDVGGNSEIVGSNTGILIESSFTIESVANSISALIDKKFESIEIRKEWLKSYNAETNYRAFAKTLSNLGS